MAENVADGVARVVWPWREKSGGVAAVGKTAASAIPVVQTVVATLVAGLFFWKHHYLMAGFVAATAGLLTICSLVWPAGYHAIERGFQWLGAGLAKVMTFVLLAPCFILVFGTGHLMLILARRDVLGAHYLKGNATYWTTRAPVTDPERHLENQY